MLKSYLPALVFLLLGIGIGTAFTLANYALGPARRPIGMKREPYESGLPSDVRKSFRFGISFYLIAMLFILFDIEVIFLYPLGVIFKAADSIFLLVEMVIFVGILLVGLIYVWRRGALDWR